MFLNTWSVALTLLSSVVLLLSAVAAKTAVKVLRYWDLTSDSNRQIQLENETWLASSLVAYALGFQIVSVILFALAADHYSQVIAGAMCATGALNANLFGLPALCLKLAGIFFYGFWIVLHGFDIQSENYPLLRAKYVFLLFLLPLLLADFILQSLYIGFLEPDIITSCCSVVFGENSGNNDNLLGAFDRNALLFFFYGLASALLMIGIFIAKRKQRRLWLIHVNGICWLLFLAVSFIAITTFFSSYIYAMPYHRCPFCILKPEYNYIGFLIYGTLLAGSFAGISISLAAWWIKVKELLPYLNAFRLIAARASLLFLVTFVGLTSYHYVIYRLFGGER